MSRLARLVLAGTVAGVAVLGAPTAQASHEPDCVTEPCYECVMYPCYPGDWVEFLASRTGVVTVDWHDKTVCVTPLAACTR